MKTRDIAIGFVFLVILITGVLLIYRVKNRQKINSPLPTPNIVQKVGDLSNFNIPDGVERTNLKDVTGGSSIGIATRTEVVANLPELSKNQGYTVLLENSKGEKIFLGRMRISKAGYILEYDSAKHPGFNKIIVVLGSTNILEGSF